MNDQLILKFPTQQAYKKEDFYVSPSNQEAYDFINSWPNWIRRIVNIFGPFGSGKSHLTSILKDKTSCLQVDGNKLNEQIFSKFKIKEALIIENYTLEEFNINNSIFKIYYYGNPKKLRSELSKFGYKLMNNQGVWHLILNE